MRGPRILPVAAPLLPLLLSCTAAQLSALDSMGDAANLAAADLGEKGGALIAKG
jgi:hypothetical protein